jgi:hypothetical protein
LYFVGQNFLFAKASEQIPGVSRDARYVVGQLEQWLAQNDRVPSLPDGARQQS